MQQFTYDKQLAAKSYVATVADADVKGIALREYPGDYAMQKFTYDKQLSAKEYMATLPDGPGQMKCTAAVPKGLLDAEVRLRPSARVMMKSSETGSA
jgi:hypothetical protein